MDPAPDLLRLRFPLEQAMALVHNDRWLVGGLAEGKLRVLADSSPEPHRPYRRTRPLSHLARRSLHERRPLTVSAVAGGTDGCSARSAGPPGPAAAFHDWEMDWPALLYAPVGLPGRRPTGLLVLGARCSHWYRQEDVDYASALGVSLSGLVMAVAGPLTRLTDRELEAARLIAQGLSVPETSAALRLGVDDARRLVGCVLRKLSVRSPGQLADRWSRLEPVGACP